MDIALILVGLFGAAAIGYAVGFDVGRSVDRGDRFRAGVARDTHTGFCAEGPHARGWRMRALRDFEKANELVHPPRPDA